MSADSDNAGAKDFTVIYDELGREKVYEDKLTGVDYDQKGASPQSSLMVQRM